MKRYRVLPFFDFDTRAAILRQEIKEEWDPHVKKLWEENQTQIREGLIAEFGTYGAFQKTQNFIDLGPTPISIIAFHNNFLRQARRAFTIGSYYPALTAACSLGERILNQLILHLRDDYRQTPEYRKVHRKDSFDNWDLAIDTLQSWGILLQSVAASFRELRETRNKAIHFNPDIDTNDRDLALSALKKLTEIVNGQFSGFGTQPWFIPHTPDETYISRSCESKPFIKRIYLPNCAYVGPRHEIVSLSPEVSINDSFPYENVEISDSEFAKLRVDHVKLKGQQPKPR
jgi:hypothetical protein